MVFQFLCIFFFLFAMCFYIDCMLDVPVFIFFVIQMNFLKTILFRFQVLSVIMSKCGDQIVIFYPGFDPISICYTTHRFGLVKYYHYYYYHLATEYPWVILACPMRSLFNRILLM